MKNIKKNHDLNKSVGESSQLPLIKTDNQQFSSFDMPCPQNELHPNIYFDTGPNTQVGFLDNIASRDQQITKKGRITSAILYKKAKRDQSQEFNDELEEANYRGLRQRRNSSKNDVFMYLEQQKAEQRAIKYQNYRVDASTR